MGRPLALTFVIEIAVTRTSHDWTALGGVTSTLARRLDRLGGLTDAALEALREVATHSRAFAARAPLVGQVSSTPTLVVASGWAAQEISLPDGRTHIFRLLLPGDMIGLARSAAISRYPLIAVTPLIVADASALVEAAFDSHADAPLRRALSKIRDHEHEAFMRQMLRLGALNARERVANLALELHERLATVGLAKGDSCPLPLRQSLLADTLGLSGVHLNRTLMALRKDGFLILSRGRLEILDREALEAVACLEGEPAPL